MGRKGMFGGSLDESQGEALKPQGYQPLKCCANGCPIFVTQGARNMGERLCVYHEGTLPKFWPSITDKLNRYDTIINLSYDLLYNWQVIDEYNSRSGEMIQALTDRFNEIGLPELAPKQNIPCIPIEGKRLFRNESAYDYGMRLEKWVRSQLVTNSMLQSSEKNYEEKKNKTFSPLAALARKLTNPAKVLSPKEVEEFF